MYESYYDSILVVVDFFFFLNMEKLVGVISCFWFFVCVLIYLLYDYNMILLNFSFIFIVIIWWVLILMVIENKILIIVCYKCKMMMFVYKVNM